MMLRVSEQYPRPVTARDHPGAAGVAYGFEGGTVARAGASLHLFTSELAGDPPVVKMRLIPLCTDGWIRERRAPPALVPCEDGRYNVCVTVPTSEPRYVDGNFGAVVWAIVERV